MSNNTNFTILRDVFNILSYASPRELLNAARQPDIPPRVASALECLSGEGRRVEKPDRVRSRGGRETIERSSDEFTKMLFQSEALREKSAIISFARQMGIKLSAGPKDSRSRILARFASAIRALPNETRLEIAHRIQGSKLSEIEGWINVINQAK